MSYGNHRTKCLTLRSLHLIPYVVRAEVFVYRGVSGFCGGASSPIEPVNELEKQPPATFEFDYTVGQVSVGFR
jgi:hypothetical protein